MIFPLRILLATTAVTVTPVSAATIATLDYIVDSHSGPFLQSANPSMPYGDNSNTAPTIVSAPFAFSAGASFEITYLSGTVYATDPTFGPFTAAGAPGGEFDHPTDGKTGKGGPGQYATNKPVNVAELLGDFADASGKVIGGVFGVGLGMTVTAPAGATQLQLGINDDYFEDESGSFKVAVTGPLSVPLPSSAPMFGAGLIALAAAGYVAKHKKAAAPA